MNPLILIGAAALLYYFYTQSQTATPAASTAPTTDTAASPTTPPAAPASPSAPAAVPGYSGPMPQTYAAVVAAALAGLGPGSGNSLQTPDVWNWYLMQAVPNLTAPSPDAMFPGAANVHAPVSFSTWWSAVSPLLPSGLSGLGRCGDFVAGHYAVPQNPFAHAMAQRWYT